MASLGKMVMIAGLALTLVGALVWWYGLRPGPGGGGLLPGDLSFKRGNVSFYFPIVTCLVISAVLTLLFRLFSR